ncbi:MAG TPA: DUF3175 domain-containing protein [Isosphaeraceae bacterium]|jgi:tRNA(adenine34) deaminase
MATKKKWSGRVKTVSTFPPEGIFTKDAETIARAMASKKVSPKGIGSGIRMVQFFINRAGKTLPDDRLRELERAKELLQVRAKKLKSKQSGAADDGTKEKRARRKSESTS